VRVRAGSRLLLNLTVSNAGIARRLRIAASDRPTAGETAQLPVSQETLDEIALSRSEYEAIVDRLGREPGNLELGLFGALWSEHCGYKHTKPLLRRLPGQSNRLLVAPGAENAGVIDIGDGFAIAMKIESHNHPSAVEPLQGAATGVGGIVRDIFAMGARPIALLDSLRFGMPQDNARVQFLVHGVVGGISWYGNCIGVPNVGGETWFDKSYTGNPLVNAMCVGLIENARIVSATAKKPGDLLVLVGADTGRDGIHGASGLASRTFEEQAEMRSAVQVGNPFLEKVLIEACLEAINIPGVNGMQDCGAAGLTSAAIEMAERSGMALRLDVSSVPRREEGMTPYEVMLSESQERMLLAVEEHAVPEIEALFEKWDLDATVIGHFHAGSDVEIFDGDTPVSVTPIEPLTSAPEYAFSAPKPEWLAKLQATDPAAPGLPAITPAQALLEMLASPNIASKRPVFRQYDHHVQTNTVVEPGGDAAVLRLKGTSRAIAVTTDCNGRLCYLDPRTGAQIAVAEACRNLACVGAEPMALTDGLNYGDPETASVQYQLVESIEGITEAANAFGIPVVSGNASLYNESAGKAIYPTPIIGALGLLEDVTRHAKIAFRRAGDSIMLIGRSQPWDGPGTLAGSEFNSVFHDVAIGLPGLDLELEVRVQELCRNAVRAGLLSSAHDCSDGGLAVTVAESAITGGLGATIASTLPARWDAALFGEGQSRIVVSLPTSSVNELEKLAAELDVPVSVIGTVGGDRITFDTATVSLADATDAWEHGFERATSA
jgi:phosphoribosylformylglycinamidine synthase II